MKVLIIKNLQIPMLNKKIFNSMNNKNNQVNSKKKE